MGNSQVSIQNSLASGEISPSLWGRTDLEKYHNGTSTCRNFFANYRGGIMSRAGLAFVGKSKQNFPNEYTTSYPPRLIPFQFNLQQGFILEFGDKYMRVISDGAYVLEADQAISGISQGSPGVFTYAGSPYSLADGDTVFISGVTGMTEFNNMLWDVAGIVTGTTFSVQDMFGNLVTTSSYPSYTGSGTLARVYTVSSPYSVQDLPYLKYTQSADTMTLTCVNTVTNVEYEPTSLVRVNDTDWVFSTISFGTTTPTPSSLSVTANSSTTPDTYYSYVVTAIINNQESIPTNPVSVENNDISLNAGSNSLTWAQVDGASSYNVYAATPSYGAVPPVSSLFGFIGTSIGPSFIDSNIIADFTQTPPIGTNPFASSGIAQINPTAGGSGYSQATVGYTLSGAGSGTGFAGIPVISGGVFTGFIIENGGQGYAPGTTINITTSGGGSGAAANVVIGPSTGINPSVSTYFQQRQVYANTLNQPDTYWMSQPGQFNNFDVSIPVIDSDAIVGTPWALQVNGIQWMVPMPGGLVVLTGNGAWQVNGGSQAAITPASQTATPQAYNGINNLVQPIVRNYDILYLQAKGSIFRDLSYNFFVNIYTGTDLTVLSDHLFTDFTMLQWCSAEEPYKLLWIVRSDGQLLCLAYLKEQDVYAWTRHDTNGLFLSVASVTELPVDAVYVVVQRFVGGQWFYFIERMNNRLWDNVEEAFCVDSGLSTDLEYPNAVLSPQAAGPVGASTNLFASTGVFSPSDVGKIIRVDGGKVQIRGDGYGNPQVVGVVIVEPLTELLTDNSDSLPLPAQPGSWSMAPLVSTITGLNHLEGLLVSILADGSVIDSQVVTNGTVTLPANTQASLVTVGLPYTCQAQTLYIDHPQEKGDTSQNRRKNISAVGVRVANTRGIEVGADQVDQSTQSYLPTPIWKNLVEVKERNPSNFAGDAVPLYTGDYYLAVTSGWDVKGQIAIQQSYPLPAQILALIAYFQTGDDR